MTRLRERGEPTPKLSNILKKIKVLQDAGFYETVGLRRGLPIIRPSARFRIFILIQDLKELKGRLEEETGRFLEELEAMIHRLEDLITAP